VIRAEAVACGSDDYPAPRGLLQSAYWAAVKQPFGWEARCFRLGDGQPLLLLQRSLPGGFRIGYVPHGPEHQPASFSDGARELREIGEALSAQLDPEPTFLRFDLPWSQRLAMPGASRSAAGDGTDAIPDSGTEFARAAAQEHLRRAPVDVQPPSTVLVPIDCDDETLLSAMKSKTRYNVRLAFRKGVEVYGASTERLEQWYDLYRETAERDRIAVHSLDYYRRVMGIAEELSGGPALELLLAEHEGELLAGIIVAYYGETATYLYGASRNHKRSLMPAYALQFRAMQRAREHGCRSYDMFGIPPDPDPSHPMYGLYRFKTGFGGSIVHRLGAWDLPMRSVGYAAYRVAERARDFYHKDIRKRGRS
jgi:lipid II:glycine glycyltransferase (peptidoglycan interpeptide bridge formation enzyme)